MTKRKKLSAILLGAILALGVGAGVGASRVETGKAADRVTIIDKTFLTKVANTSTNIPTDDTAPFVIAPAANWRRFGNASVATDPGGAGNWHIRTGSAGDTVTYASIPELASLNADDVDKFYVTIYGVANNATSGNLFTVNALDASGEVITGASDTVVLNSTSSTSTFAAIVTASVAKEAEITSPTTAVKGFKITHTTRNANTIFRRVVIEYVPSGGEQPPLPDVESLQLVSGPTKTTYTAGENFDPTGVSIKASFADGSDANVTSLVTYTPSPLIQGTTQVVASYTQGVTKTVTITGITVNAAPTFTLSSASNLKVGATYTIASKTGFAISSQSGAFFSSTAVTYSTADDTFLGKTDVLKFELENGSVMGSYAFKILNTAQAGEYIVYDADKAGNALHSAIKTTVDAAASWTFHDTNGIVNVGQTSRVLQYNAGNPRFACYGNYGQTLALLFVDESTIPYEPEFETTTRIVIASDFAKTTFFTRETFTTAGLIIVAHDDNNGVSKNVDSGFSTDLDGKVFTSSDVADGISVTVTYDGIDETYLIDVKEARSFVKVGSESQLEVGKIYIATGVIPEEEIIVAMGKVENNNRNVVSVITDAGKVYENNDVQLLKLHNGHESVDGSFAFESVGGAKDGKFLAATGTNTNNYMTSQDTITVKGSWIITIDDETGNTTIVATDAGTERNNMRYNSTNSLFSAYGSTGQNAITLYALEEDPTPDPDIAVVDDFVDTYMFMDEIEVTDKGTGECKSEGLYADAKAAFNALSATQRALFVTDAQYDAPRARLLSWADANNEGLITATNTLGVIVSPSQNAFFNGLNDSNTIMLIVIISLISVSVLGGVFYLRKKEQN